jgi:hypothetical protein
MDEATPPAKPRLAFGTGRSTASGGARTARKHVPVEDALSRMAGKIGERRRASGPRDDDADAEAATA